jgi:ABC-2 type transport system ATP-binding protein
VTISSIQTINLTKQYNKFIAVNNLNLKIQGQKCVGFLGPNGAGKTTTLKIFTDLIKPSLGQALINGVNVQTRKKEALAQVGSLIETPEIYPSLTPREALSMIAKLRGIPKEEQKKRIEETIEEVQMDQAIDKRIGKFSKGMKQRICLAGALLGNPTVILLDEPTVGLDPRGVAEIRAIIKSLKSKDRLIFMSSHILNEVADVCDEVAIIDHGTLIAYDSLEQLTSKFSGENSLTVEAGFEKTVTNSEIRSIEKLPNVVSVEKMDEKQLKIVSEKGSCIQKQLLENIVSLNVGLISFEAVKAELEEVYLKIIADTR